MKEHSPNITSTEMIREIEMALEGIEKGEVSSADVIEKAATHILLALDGIKKRRKQVWQRTE